MNIAQFERHFEAVHQGLQLLHQQVDVPSKALPEGLSALLATIEELHVAVEEIEAQNQELTATHHALIEEHQRYQELFEEAPDGYLETNNQGTIQRANRAIATLLNVPQQDLISKRLTVFVSSAERRAFNLQLSALRQQQIFGWEVNLQPREADPIPVELSVSTKYGRQQIQGWRWIVRDLTQRRQAEATRRQLEAQTQLSEFKTSLLNSISHEFRTPLNIISMSVSTVERFFPLLKEQQRQVLFRRMRIAIKYITQLLEEVEFLHEAERLSYSSATIVELEPFCHNLIADLQELFGTSHRINLEVCNGRAVCLNTKLLQQILKNLLSNSLRYSPEGSLIVVTVICEADSVKFQVQDRGIGIPEEDQSHIFQPFYRGQNANKAHTISGTGLGLATVSKAVEYSGGAITFTSEEGFGSTFTVTLPLKISLP
ncbi:MAG: ATP-binding protein [Cyanophyceae cyanobacterium]